MPNLNNLETKWSETPKKPFTGRPGSRLLQVEREEILFRTDIKTSFGYALTGIVIVLAIAGGTYVIGKQLLK